LPRCNRLSIITVAVAPLPLELLLNVNKVILSVLEGGMVVTALYNEQQQNKRKTDHWQLPRSTKDVSTRSCSCLH
jgi:hypothetical protein